ncbi:type II secretion system F family protein [Herbaspirillum sp. YR522]|uniref:type II secretion system F family protein n=1 Tax=Herbaspirillum sp. YR522 TaxID=1144342 RepID=UPI00026FB395|nr:type II secretion system F family protein [Herbaspirillum sp. YR522]EJN02846.1 type II secretory pathway, component PulF [Herbaspirillum sp. YR522]
MPAPEPTPAPSTSSAARQRPFEWEGLDRQGLPQRGTILAHDVALARAALRRQGLRVARIGAAGTRGGAAATTRRATGRARGRISDKQVAAFLRQLATMLQAGLPLLQALDIATDDGRGEMAPLLQAIRADVAAGESLHAALARHPRQFEPLVCNLVRAAELAGMLDSMLDRIALYREKSLALRGKIRAALAYPCAVLAAAMVVTVVIMLWVVPSFEEMFRNFGAELPWPTRVVVTLSRGLARHWLPLLGALVLAGVGARLLLRRPGVRQAWQRASLSLPLAGGLLRRAAIARWSRTFGTLFGAGIVVVDALESAAGSAGNIVFAEASLAMRRAVGHGTTLHAAMRDSGVFPEMTVQMVAVGEQSGALDAMLARVAELAEREVDDAVNALTSLMEPIIMAVLGILIGGLVVAMYLPIFNMGSVL